MEQGEPSNECDLTEMAHRFGEIANRLVQELELMTGKKLVSPVVDIDSRILRKLIRVVTVATDLEEAFSEPLTAESARKILRLWNMSLRLTIPRIPRGAEPSEYVIHQIEQYAEPPAGFVPPDGLNYESKHLELRTYVSEVAAVVSKSALDTFTQNCFIEHRLVPQFQRIFSKMLLPKELRKPITKASVRSAEAIKVALHQVIAQWETLVDVLYGLVLLRQDRSLEFDKIHKLVLWNKVTIISRQPRLANLVKLDWVTVRNSVNHGTAFYDPSEQRIEFPDQKRKVSWSLEQAYLEAIDIYLSTEAMMRVWIFVQAASVSAQMEFLVRLKALAQQ